MKKSVLKKALVIVIALSFVGIINFSTTGILIKMRYPTELIIEGPTYGRVGEELEYTLILNGTVEETVWIKIDWGDGDITDWYGPYAANEEIKAYHSWNECDVYTIHAVARCNNTDYHAYLEVKISSVIEITVHEAWELLTDTSNGIQTPIDIRTDDEWNESFIDTPYPEHPVHINFSQMDIEEFFELFEGKEIILYDKGGYHSYIIGVLLCEAGFIGTVYNMYGGIYEWIKEGYPIRNNTPPDAPDIDGPASGKVNTTYDFSICSIDTEEDYVSYYIDWGDNTSDEFGLFPSGVEVIVDHTWYEKGSYLIRCKATDMYGLESEWFEHIFWVDKSRSSYNFLFHRFLERLLNKFTLIGCLLWL